MNYAASGEQFGKVFLEPNAQYSMAIGMWGGNNLYNHPGFLAKMNSDGSADYTYGKRGKVNFYPGFASNERVHMYGNAAALQTDGKMVVGLATDTVTASSNLQQKAWVIARYEKNARVKYNTLVSDVFTDNNSNGIKDAGEEPFESIYSLSTTKQGATDTLYWWSSPQYNYSSLQDVDTGTYHTSVNLYSHPYYTVVPANRITSHSTYWNTDTLSFAVHPIPGIRDLSVMLIRLNTAKPGFPIHYLLKVHNAGTDSAGNVVVKLVKSNKMVYDSATTTPASVVADTLTWNIGGLQSQHDAFIIFYGKVKMPPAANIGDTMQAVATVTSNKPDTVVSDNTSSMTHYVFGALDPNDKTESHAGKITMNQVATGDYLTYTIRFQNTGNDTAFNVYIHDTLNTNLDWSTMQMLTSSANYQMTMNDGKCVWSFNNINLVDSIKNEPLSHGYLVYRIKPKAIVQVGDIITNRAAIYFDYNLPVITNTENTTVVADVFPLRLLSFTAKQLAMGNRQWAVHLNWTSENEINFDHYDVERSFDSREFVRMQNVKCKTEPAVIITMMMYKTRNQKRETCFIV